ncbi:MAG: SocA family protein [Lachnospiraceae bacterium]|nr:SocA family protein [Lachnospiraceae bacterium]
MRDVYEYAKFFIKNGADSTPNTYDGNMKLQKLLVFANLIYLAQYDEFLFDDDVLAFKNGCVIEKIRLRYRNDYYGLKQDSDRFEPDFTEKEYEVLKTALDIFGSATARELSEINHTFQFWNNAYQKGTDSKGYYDKSKSVVNFKEQPDDIEKMREVLDAYRQSVNEVTAKEVINGITFFYDGFTLTDDMIEKLEMFSLTAEDNAYSVYMDSGRLVIC